MSTEQTEAPETPDYDLQRLEAEANAEAQADEQAATPEEAAGDNLPDIPTAEMLRPIIDLGCGVMVPAWNISEQERKALADAYAALVDKYMPDTGLGPYAVEINVLLLTAAIVGPRLGQPKHHEPAKEAPEAKPKQEPEEGRPVMREAVGG